MYILVLSTALSIVYGQKAVSLSRTEVKSLYHTTKEDDIVSVDVEKKYPKKEAISIHDIADVNYIPLETKEGFWCDGGVVYLDNNHIICHNTQLRDGNIFIFNGKGKAIRRINRKGEGNEEYSGIFQVIYDDLNKELYVNDVWLKKIFVYDLKGNYKRSFGHLKGKLYNRIYSFNKEYLLCYSASKENFEDDRTPFLVISKQNGNKEKDIVIPFNKRIAIKCYTVTDKQVLFPFPFKVKPEPAVKCSDGFLLNEISSDTIYKLADDFSITPIIAQYPSVQQKEQPLFLLPTMETYQYRFMMIAKKEDYQQTGISLLSALVYDKKGMEFYEQNFYNDDYISNAYIKKQPVVFF
jgi:hypothetical protein